MCHPNDDGTYYDKAIAGWNATGSTWTISEWSASFRYDAATAVIGTRWTDPEGRRWEFFGYTIPLYDEGDDPGHT
jgi:hypothetical protein